MPNHKSVPGLNKFNKPKRMEEEKVLPEGEEQVSEEGTVSDTDTDTAGEESVGSEEVVSGDEVAE